MITYVKYNVSTGVIKQTGVVSSLAVFNVQKKEQGFAFVITDVTTVRDDTHRVDTTKIPPVVVLK